MLRRIKSWLHLTKTSASLQNVAKSNELDILAVNISMYIHIFALIYSGRKYIIVISFIENFEKVFRSIKDYLPEMDVNSLEEVLQDSLKWMDTSIKSKQKHWVRVKYTHL